MTDAAAIPEPYKWDESFDVKVDSINDQHKKLFELIDALAKDQGNADILNELLDTVKKHFQWEEVRRARPGGEAGARPGPLALDTLARVPQQAPPRSLPALPAPPT